MLAELDWEKTGVENGSDGHFWIDMKIGGNEVNSPIQAINAVMVNEEEILSRNLQSGVPIIIYRAGANGNCLIQVNEDIVKVESMIQTHTWVGDKTKAVTHEINNNYIYVPNFFSHEDKVEIKGKLKKDPSKDVEAKIYFVPNA